MRGPVYFVSGGTLSLAAESYVERSADHTLLDALVCGRYAYVLNARQMGKSSLCVRTVARLEAKGFRTAFVDLTRIGGRNVTPDQWYIGLLGEIGRAVGQRAAMVAHWKENADMSPMQRFFGAIADHALSEGTPPLVVFVDEVDATRSLPFSADEFFGGIRECFNRRAQDPKFERLTFCLLGAAIPSDLIKDTEASPFNVGERVAIRDFTREEAIAFATGLGRSGMTLANRVHHWTRGHPFLTQSLCERLAESGATTPADVDRLVETELFTASARETNINLADVGNRVLLSQSGGDPDRHRAEILALYDRVRRRNRVEDDESNPRIAILKLSGLLVAENGLLRLRNRIYERVFGARWVSEHMPDGEARRIRRAYRLGLLRAAIVGATMLAIVGALALNTANSARQVENALANAKKERDRAVTAEKTSAISAREATEARNEAQRLSLERARALDLARRDRSAALVSAERESVAHRGALVDAAAARSLALVAERQTRVGKQATEVAVTALRRAQVLLYTSNMQLVGDAIAAGSGVRAASLLAESKSPDGRPSWAERHYRAVLREDALYPGHLGRVGRVAFTPTGDVLTLDGYEVDETGVTAVMPGRGALRRWDAATGRLSAKISLHDVPGATSMDLSWDGRTAIIGLADGSLRSYSTDDFRLVGAARGAEGSVDNLQATALPDRVLASYGLSQFALSLSDAAPPERLETLLPSGSFSRLRTVPLPDGDLLRTGIESRSGLGRFSPAPGGAYRMRWFVRTEGIGTIAVSSDGRWIAYATKGLVRLVDAATGRLRGKPIEHPSDVFALAFSSDGRQLASGSDDGTTKITNVTDGDLLTILAVRHPEITSLAFSRDGQTLAIGSGDGTAELRSLNRRTGVPDSFPRADGHMAASRAGLLLLDSPTVWLYVVDPKTGGVLHSFVMTAERWASDISPDGRTVAAVGDDGGYRAWDAKTGASLVDASVFRTLGCKGLTLGPRGMALVYMGGEAGNGDMEPSEFALVDARSGRAVIRRRGTGLFADGRFAPDGARFALARQSGTATVYDVRTAGPLFDLPNPRGDRASRLAYSPDGRTIGVGRRSGWIDLYDARTGQPKRSWPGHAGQVLALAVSVDGRTLTSLGADRTRRTWDLGSGRSMGTEKVAAPGRDIWFGETDECVYFADGGIIQVRRVGGDLIPTPPAPRLPALPDPFAAMREAKARAKAGRKPILVFLRPARARLAPPLHSRSDGFVHLASALRGGRLGVGRRSRSECARARRYQVLARVARRARDASRGVGFHP